MADGYYRSGNYVGDVPQYKTLRTAEEEDQAQTIIKGFDPQNQANRRSAAIMNNPANSLASLRQNPPVLRNPAMATEKQLGQLSRDATPVQQTGRSDQTGGFGLRASQNAQYSDNFARMTKRIVAKRGLTRAQRSSQLGALETAERIRQGGYSGSDVKQVEDLSKAATRRGLTRNQRTQLMTASNDILSSVEKAAGKKEATQKNFTERLLDELDLYGDD